MREGFMMPEDVRQRFSMWWRGEDFGRPLCRIIGRTGEPNFSLRGVSPRDFHIGAAVRVAMMREEMRVSRYFADAFPYLDLNLGPGSLAAYLGCEPKFSYDTVWYEPCAETIAELSEKDFMRFSPWWEEHLREVRETVRLSEGEFPVGIPDVQENIDILAAMRGAQNLCYDLMDEPETVKTVLSRLEGAADYCYDEMYRAVALADGSSVFTAFAIWGSGRTAKVQCDFSAMISPGAYREFVLPGLMRECARLDHSLYHLDGPGALVHAGAVLSIPSLQALQWTSGAGQNDGGSEEWFPLYDKVMDAGKSLWIQIYEGEPYVWLERAKKIVRRYGTRGIYFVFAPCSVEDAAELARGLKV